MSEFVGKSLGEAEQTARYAVKQGIDQTGAIGVLLAEFDARGAALARVRAELQVERETRFASDPALAVVSTIERALDGQP